MKSQAKLRTGVAILVVAAASLLAASFAIVTPSPGLSSKIGRHLLAGALANACVALSLAALALIPIRRGESWALWLYLLIAAFYGIPIFVVDATHVARERLVATLLPQAAGLITMSVGLLVAARGMFAGKKERGRLESDE